MEILYLGVSKSMYVCMYVRMYACMHACVSIYHGYLFICGLFNNNFKRSSYMGPNDGFINIW
jgi:hypothetical protein